MRRRFIIAVPMALLISLLAPSASAETPPTFPNDTARQAFIAEALAAGNSKELVNLALTDKAVYNAIPGDVVVSIEPQSAVTVSCRNTAIIKHSVYTLVGHVFRTASGIRSTSAGRPTCDELAGRD